MTKDLATRVAREYVVEALDRRVHITGVLLGDQANDALVLCRAADGDGDFSLHVLGQDVIDECDVTDFFESGGVEEAR